MSFCIESTFRHSVERWLVLSWLNRTEVKTGPTLSLGELQRSDQDISPGKAKTARNFGRAMGVLFLLFTPLIGRAQMGPEMRGPLSIHLFGTYSYGSSDGDTGNSYGYSLGGFVQTPHLWGLEVRGAYLRWGSDESRFDAMAGPRVALRFARFSPYGAVLLGAGHPLARLNGPNSQLESNTGAELKVLGGVDYYAGRHFSIRLGELSFSEYYALPKGVSAIDVSGGIAYHLPVRER
jgi:hypothetical protein